MMIAEESAERLHYEFMCSAVWTEIFKSQNSISFGRVGDEARGVNIDKTTEYLTAV